MVETLPASANDAGLIPGWGVKIPHASQPKKKKKKTSILKNKKQYCSKFNKDFNSPHQKKNFFLNGEELQTVSADKTSRWFVIKGGECNEPIFTAEVKSATPTGRASGVTVAPGPLTSETHFSKSLRAFWRTSPCQR